MSLHNKLRLFFSFIFSRSLLVAIFDLSTFVDRLLRVATHHSLTMLGTKSASAEQLVESAPQRQQVNFAKK